MLLAIVTCAGTEQQLSKGQRARQREFLPPGTGSWKTHGLALPQISRVGQAPGLTFCQAAGGSSLDAVPIDQCHRLMFGGAACGLLFSFSLILVFRVHQH